MSVAGVAFAKGSFIMTAHFPNTSGVMSELVDFTPRRSIYRSATKRAFDITFVLAVSVFVLPIVLLLAAIIMLDGSSPFYVQTRVGKGGRSFKMVKLRSMVGGADRELTDYLAANPTAAEEWRTTQKLRRDPRITAIGSIIRRMSLDELPQFWNVLMGDMSVVGPRPMLPNQRELYAGQAYYALRPGVTGLWQVGDRNNTSFAARARFDSDYYQMVSFFGDLRIILRTVRVMMRGTGC